ncbi:hypothetical protein BJ165DRAFT_1446016 [Panaeolus papilionaceus]|nr:hypothetical protein BJ165DRAFT_1446016 [Panaeolus papilionaceus]
MKGSAATQYWTRRVAAPRAWAFIFVETLTPLFTLMISDVNVDTPTAIMIRTYRSVIVILLTASHRWLASRFR